MPSSSSAELPRKEKPNGERASEQYCNLGQQWQTRFPKLGRSQFSESFCQRYLAVIIEIRLHDNGGEIPIGWVPLQGMQDDFLDFMGQFGIPFARRFRVVGQPGIHDDQRVAG